jgi:hypothetical protein
MIMAGKERKKKDTVKGKKVRKKDGNWCEVLYTVKEGTTSWAKNRYFCLLWLN